MPSTQRYTQVPVLTNWRSTDSVWRVRAIMEEHEYGHFHNSSTFWEECLTDDRIAAVLDTRIGGLLGADLAFIPSDEKRKARKLADILGGSDQTQDDGLWLKMLDADSSAELLKWRIGLGVAFGTIEWKVINGEYVPRVMPWHPRFLRYDWGRRRFYAISQEDGMIELPDTESNPRGDGKWFFWGGYRSWMNGLVRSLGMKYIDRGWTERDWSRYCEKYGLNIIEGKVPSTANEDEKENFRLQLANLGSEPTIMTPQLPGEPGSSFGLQMHEATAQGWQTFKERKSSLDTDIAVRVLGQNLTTEVKGGSLAASKVHEGIRGDVKRRDARFFEVVRQQVLCWWSFYNWGDADLAPYPRAEIETPADPTDEATELKVIGEACNTLLLANPAVDVEAIMETHGVPLLDGAEKDAAVQKADQQKQLPQPGEAPKEGQEPTPPPTGTSTLETMGLVALKSSSKGGPLRRKLYEKAVVNRARRMAAGALEGDVQQALEAIREASSLEDVKKLILKQARKSGAGIKELATIVERVNLLAHLDGRADVLRQVVK